MSYRSALSSALCVTSAIDPKHKFLPRLPQTYFGLAMTLIVISSVDLKASA